MLEKDQWVRMPALSHCRHYHSFSTDDHTGILAFITTMRVSCNFLLSTGISWGQTTLKHITHPEERKSQQALRTW